MRYQNRCATMKMYHKNVPQIGAKIEKSEQNRRFLVKKTKFMTKNYVTVVFDRKKTATSLIYITLQRNFLLREYNTMQHLSIIRNLLQQMTTNMI